MKEENGNPESAESASNKDVCAYEAIVIKMANIFISKNHDYGNSFSESVQELGENLGVIAGFVPIMHKFNRLKNIIKGAALLVKDEAIDDTLLDMANYCIMLKMEIDRLREHVK